MKNVNPYTIKIGDPCHTEQDAGSMVEAIIRLWALAHKEKPEFAAANVLDYRNWLDNSQFRNKPLPIHWAKEIRALIDKEDYLDQKAEAHAILNVPDMTIRQEADGTIMIRCDAMQFESCVRSDRVGNVVEKLVTEYRLLLIAGELSGEIIEA